MNTDVGLVVGGVVLSTDVDPVRLAGLLRRAHAMAIDTGVAPRMVRPVISDSWRRSADAGVDPARPARRMLDAQRTAQRLAAHPVARVLPKVSELLNASMIESRCFAAFSDAEGVLLWTDGSSRALQSAVAPRFLPGFLCGEDQIGTNALGTALVLDAPVQIFSAEHFNQLLHGWSCAAAPIHDPDTGELLGAIDLSGELRTAHVHGLALVAAVARAVEGWLATERRAADELLVRRYQQQSSARPQRFSGVVTSSGRVVFADPLEWLGRRVDVLPGSDRWPQPDGTSLQARPIEGGFLVWRHAHRRPPAGVAVLSPDRVTITIAGHRHELHLRHSEIVVLLALNPAGLTVRELALALYGDAKRTATVRAEISRLRRVLGDLLLSRPYRLAGRVRIDPGGAAQLLPRSVAPGIVAARTAMQP